MRSSPRLVLLGLVVVAVFGTAAVACGSVAKPSGWAPPALDGNLVLVAHKDKLYALDVQTLQEKWRFPGTENKNVKPSALYGSFGRSGSTIFVPSYNGKLYAVAADTGLVSGDPFDAGQALVGGVAVDSGTVYFGSSDGNLYAIDATTGRQRWKFPTGNEIWSTPVVSENTVYVTSLDGRLYAVDAASGAEQWSYKTAAGVASSPVVDPSAGLVYVAGFDSRLRAINITTHEQKWQMEAGNWFWTQPFVANGVVFAGSLDSKVYAVNVSTGESPWSRPFGTKSPVHAAPVLADNKLIVVDRGGHVYGLTPADGTQAPAVDLDVGGDVLADPLVLPDGKVLIVTTGGNVVRIDPQTLTIVDQRQL